MAPVPQVLEGLKNTFLVATSGLKGTPFERAVIYMVSHTPAGAMGLTVNHPVPQLSFQQIAQGMGIEDALQARPLSGTYGARDPIILRGGPVESNRGFVLHTGDYHLPSTQALGPDVGLSASADIVTDIAQGRGPRQVNFCLGCAMWAPGQLDMEMHENGWLVVPADGRILFELPAGQRYDACTRMLGLDTANFTDVVGLA